jgi:hypothetical protein
MEKGIQIESALVKISHSKFRTAGPGINGTGTDSSSTVKIGSEKSPVRKSDRLSHTWRIRKSDRRERVFF